MVWLLFRYVDVLSCSCVPGPQKVWDGEEEQETSGELRSCPNDSLYETITKITCPVILVQIFTRKGLQKDAKTCFETEAKGLLLYIVEPRYFELSEDTKI